MMLLALIFSLFVAGTFATYGVDVSQRTYSDSFSCLVSNGYSFTIVRVYQSNGQPDSNGPSTINDAWAGGMSYVDGYIFPCYSCGNPAKQVNQAHFFLCIGNHNPNYFYYSILRYSRWMTPSITWPRMV